MSTCQKTQVNDCPDSIKVTCHQDNLPAIMNLLNILKKIYICQLFEQIQCWTFIIVGYMICFQGPCSRFQPMTDWCWFGILVGTELLSFTEFKMNFVVKWSAGGISKFITQSLFFVITNWENILITKNKDQIINF